MKYTFDDLKQSDQFVLDAADFLSKRTGEIYTDPDSVMEAYKDHFRMAGVNEATMLRDLDYARKATQEDKDVMRNLVEAFEGAEDEYDLEMVGDYAYGLATAPSTYASIFTGGAGKLASQGGIQAAKLGLKEVLKKTGSGALKGAAVDSATAAFGEDVRQRTREEVGLERQEDMVAYAALGGGVFGGLTGGLGGFVGGKMAKSASELEQKSQDSISKLNLSRREKARKTREKLRKLDPTLVKSGEELLKDMYETNKGMSVRMSEETIEAVASAAMELARGLNLNVRPGERVTEAVARGITRGSIQPDRVREVMKAHDITTDQFAQAYMATISKAGKTLGEQGKIRKMLLRMSDFDLTTKLDADQRKALEAGDGSIARFMKDLDRLRLASMTSQLVTTARNVIGGGYRLFVDALDEGWDSTLAALTGQKTVSQAFKDTGAVTKFLTTGVKEARVIQEMFSNEMPAEARKLFFTAADAEARTGSTSFLGKIGSGINIMNTMTDTVYKRAVFSASLDRQLREAGFKGIVDVIEQGKFNQLDPRFFQKATEEALYFTYQKRPSMDTVAGKVANSVIDMHRDAPFLVSSVIPFPRFIANQMQFAYEHSPILPLVVKGLTGKNFTRKDISQQLSTASLLVMAVQYRSQQEPSTKWNEHVADDGQVMDLAPVLGPMAPLMLIADAYVRTQRGDPIPSIESYLKEGAQSLGTPRFSGSFGIPSIDRLWADVQDQKFSRAAGKFAGDVAGTFLIPAVMLRDIVSVYDEDQTYIRNMDTVLPSTGEPMIDFLNYSMHYATKNMPMSFGPEDRMSSITRGELRRVNPFERQFTGFTRYERKTELQKELDRLQIDRSAIFPRDPDPIRNTLNAGVIGDILPARMAEYMRSDKYQGFSDTVKAQQLVLMAKKVIQDEDVKGYVDEMMQEMVGVDKDTLYIQFFREAWEEMPALDRKILEEEWQKSPEYTGKSITAEGAFHWAVNNQPRIKGLR